MSARKRTPAPPRVEDWREWRTEAGDDWLDRLTALLPFHRSERGRAMEAAHGSTDILDLHAFLGCWGTSEAIALRGRALANALRWWEARGPLDPEDLRATEGLAVALDRLWGLYGAALWVEEQVAEAGYRFDPETRLLLERTGRPGPPRSLVSEVAGKVFDVLVEEGREPANTGEIRSEIRDRLSMLFHPDLLSTDRGSPIHSAVNARLNPDRH
jgi:hypothetical protein